MIPLFHKLFTPGNQHIHVLITLSIHNSYNPHTNMYTYPARTMHTEKATAKVAEH